MPTLETLVRPFTNTNTNPTTGVDSVPQPVNNAVLFINGSGQTKSGGYSLSSSVTCYADAKHVERRTASGALIASSRGFTINRRGIWAAHPMAGLMRPPIPQTTMRR